MSAEQGPGCDVRPEPSRLSCRSYVGSRVEPLCGASKRRRPTSAGELLMTRASSACALTTTRDYPPPAGHPEGDTGSPPAPRECTSGRRQDDLILTR